MRSNRPPLTVVAIGLAAAALLSGCVIAPARPYPYAYGSAPQQPGYDTPDGGAAAAPPPPREEYIGVAPFLGWIWLSGFWAWQLNRHVWIGGHWDAPRPGYRWYPHEWHHNGGYWQQRPGYWGR